MYTPSLMLGVTVSVVPAETYWPKEVWAGLPVVCVVVVVGCSSVERTSAVWLSSTRIWGLERILVSELFLRAVRMIGTWSVLIRAAVRPPRPVAMFFWLWNWSGV